MSYSVKVLTFVAAWSTLFALIRPVAVLALILYPFVWLLFLPLRCIEIGVQAGLTLMGFRKGNA